MRKDISNNNVLLTVTTPTYNRAHTLPACYRSLCEQTDQRFVWLVIDDGSGDNTEELINSWRVENKIEIRYKKKENGGKASALNVGIELLDTPYAVCLDSDDMFYPEAVKKAIHLLMETESDENCCGILALRNNPDGSVMGHKSIPYHMHHITAKNIFLDLNFKTELICFYKVEILKRFRFPEFEGEKFVSPAWMQYAITQNYYYATSWDKICCCEYVADGLTKNKRKVIMKNPRGYTCVKRFSFDLSPNLRLKIKHGIMYDCGCLIGHDKAWMKNVKHKILAAILMPIAFLIKLKRFSENGSKQCKKKEYVKHSER